MIRVGAYTQEDIVYVCNHDMCRCCHQSGPRRHAATMGIILRIVWVTTRRGYPLLFGAVVMGAPLPSLPGPLEGLPYPAQDRACVAAIRLALHRLQPRPHKGIQRDAKIKTFPLLGSHERDPVHLHTLDADVDEAGYAKLTQ